MRFQGRAIDPRMTFDTFVAGSPNEMALGVAKQVAHAALNNAVTFNPVYIHSTVGLGKSHLLNAIAWAAGAADSSRNIVYLTADHFMYHFIQAVQRQSALAFKDWLRRVDLLLIDDMQFLQGKSATEFGHTLGTLLTGAKQVVVAADSPPRDLEMLDERVKSRLSGGLVVPINGFDVDLRHDIVEKRAGQATTRFGVHFPAAVIDYIAHVVVSHGRDLDGAVNRLVAANQLTGEPITVPLAERTLADLVRSREAKRVRIEDILRIVSRHFKVPRNDLLSLAPLPRRRPPAPDRDVSRQGPDLPVAPRDRPAIWRQGSHDRPPLGPEGRTDDEGRRRPLSGDRAAEADAGGLARSGRPSP